jgi:hypothetical protein
MPLDNERRNIEDQRGKRGDRGSDLLCRSLSGNHRRSWEVLVKEITVEFRIAVFLRHLRGAYSSFRHRSEAPQVQKTKIGQELRMIPSTAMQSSADNLLNAIRALLVPARDNGQELTTIDIHRMAFASREKLPGLGFRYGSPLPYSERLEDLMHILYSTGELEFSRRDPCKILVTDKLRVPGGESAHP